MCPTDPDANRLERCHNGVPRTRNSIFANIEIAGRISGRRWRSQLPTHQIELDLDTDIELDVFLAGQFDLPDKQRPGITIERLAILPKYRTAESGPTLAMLVTRYDQKRPRIGRQEKIELDPSQSSHHCRAIESVAGLHCPAQMIGWDGQRFGAPSDITEHEINELDALSSQLLHDAETIGHSLIHPH